MENFNLEEYLSNGVENVVSEIMRATIHNPKESMFMAKYVMDSRNACRLRKKSEKKGEHIPPFLIASITTRCNLHCKGCYARANHNCHDDESKNRQMLDTARWGTIFKEAEEMGIGFILLAGGEPFLRRDVLQEASKHTRIIFPVFTNGTMLLEEEIALLDKSRNLIPVLSIEGDQDITDARRGEGTYQKLMKSMQQLQAKGIVFAASVTVTKDNKNVVLGDDFIDTLEDMGCKGVIYVEYVPVDASTKTLALDDETRNDMMKQLNTLRREKQEMVFIAFPGDEKSSGGCLAAGRGFFHLQDDFMSKFWRFATMEQYQDQDIYEIYRSIFFEQSMAYQKALFEEMIRQGIFVKEDARIMAMHYYAPLFFLLSKYAGREELAEEALELLDRHVETFYRIYRTKN